MNFENVTVSIEDFLNVPSPHMTIDNMISLAKRIDEGVMKEGFEGVVLLMETIH